MPEKVHVDVQDIYDNVIGESIIEVNIDEKSKNDIEENVKDVVEQKTKNKEMLGVYDINITRTDNMVDKQEQNLLSKTLVTLSIPASQKYDMCEVYHIKDDGKVVEESVEEITYANEKLTIKFYTESFSTFIIVTPKAKSDVPVFKPDKNVEPGNSYMTITMIQHEAIIEGYDDKTYRPNDNVTREQVAALFARLDSDYNDKVDYAQYIKNNGINDVKTDTWSSNYIGYMIKKGIMNTVSKGKFMPDKPCTRAEIVKIICSFKKFNANGYECEFDDAKGTWYEQYVSILVEKGFIDGYEDGMFKGEKNVTRAEIAKLITIMENRTLENTSRITNSMITTIKNKYRDLDENAWYFPYVFELAYDHSVQLIH